MMEDTTAVNWDTQGDQLQNETLRHQRDEDIRDDDLIGSDRISGSKQRAVDADENDADDDDAGLSDDDLGGRDLDIDNSDEWDEADMEDELDDRDLEDDDQVIADLHNIKNDQFGSIALEIENKEPDETPEERQTHTKEYGAPSEKEFGVGTQPGREFDYQERKEVQMPDTGQEANTPAIAPNTF